MTLDQIRREFPVADSCVYLDNAYRGPFPLRGARAMAGYVERWSALPFPDGRTDIQLRWADGVREKVANLLEVSSDEVLFSRSTTDALYAVASSLLKPGDEILVGGLDHPADYGIWLRLAGKGIRVTVVPHQDGSMSAEALAEAIGPATRAIGMCLVNTYNGYRQDLTALSDLCSRRGLHLLLDAIQAMGHLEIDLKSNNVTAMSAGVYKWFCAPEGLGVAYVNRKVLEQVVPEAVHFYRASPVGDEGWSGFMRQVFRSAQEGTGPWAVGPGLLKFPMKANRLELSANFLAMAGLEATVDILTEFGGMAAVERRVLGLTAHLRASVQEHGHTVLSSSDPEHASGITSVAVPDGQKFAQYCQQRGIWVLAQWTARPGTQAVRVSPHVYNNEDDIAAFVRALDSFVPGHA